MDDIGNVLQKGRRPEFVPYGLDHQPTPDEIAALKAQRDALELEQQTRMRKALIANLARDLLVHDRGSTMTTAETFVVAEQFVDAADNFLNPPEPEE